MLDSIHCDEIFPPVFLTKDRTMIQAMQKIEKINIKLSKPEGIGFHIGKMEHYEVTNSLLYTTEELQA